MPAALRVRRVVELGPAVSEQPIVQVLQLSRLDAELGPVRGGIHHFAHRGQGVTAHLVERLAGQCIALDDVVLVVAGGERAAVECEHGVRREFGIRRAMLGLTVPMKGLIEPWQQLRMSFSQLVVRGEQARVAAEASVTR